MNLTLVVMAAGMGSRFGGLKQITPVDEDENFIIDYSIYDALRVGFTKVVFIIREEFLKDFQETIGKRLEGKIEVCYAFQKLDTIPIEMDISSRQKPWGTAQAILAARPYVDGSFVVINADDFYGANAYQEAVNFFKNVQNSNEYACISYSFEATKSLEGAVKRGILVLDDNKIVDITEASVGYEGSEVVAHPLDGSNAFTILPDAPVSMNLFAFQQGLFDLLDEYWIDYFKQDKETILEGEVLLPECLKKNIKNSKITVYNCPSNSNWIGMTYRSDLKIVEEKLNDLKNQGIYPKHLWEEYSGKDTN